MFDAHCHLHFEAFDDDLDAVLADAADAGVRGVIVADYDSARRPRLFEIARRRGVWATAGVHPWAVADGDDAWLDAELERLARDLDEGDVVGLGELGLDRVRCEDAAGWARQQRAFRAQLEMARERDLPIVVHAVRATSECLDIIEAEGAPSAGGMIHGFSGTPQEASRAVELGLDVSIGTSLIRRNAGRIAEVVRRTDLTAMLVETDAPSRPPQGIDATRNEPRFVDLVVERVAEILDVEPAEVARVTEENARRRFRLDDGCLSARSGATDVNGRDEHDDEA